MVNFVKAKINDFIFQNANESKHKQLV